MSLNSQPSHFAVCCSNAAVQSQLMVALKKTAYMGAYWAVGAETGQV